MKIHQGTAPIKSIENAVVTAGTFDGVHLGHQEILKRLRNIADRTGGQTVLITYWPHPRLVLKPEQEPLHLLSTFTEKAGLLAQYGIEHLVKIPFTRELSQMTPEAYIRVMFHERINTTKMVIGYDHRFGKLRSGGLTQLKQLSTRFNFEVEEISKQTIDEIGISSTQIRRALATGNIAMANRHLGRNYSLTGSVVQGKKIGRSLGFPTANIEVKEDYKLIPADGIYAVKVWHKQKEMGGMLNIGRRPTFGGEEKVIEVHIFDFDKDIYGCELKIVFINHIRSEIKFESLTALKRQLKEDEKAVRKILMFNNETG